MPSSGLDSEPSLCVEGGTREVRLHAWACACVSVWYIMDQPCVFQLQPGRNLLAANFWPGFSFPLLVLLFRFNLRKKIFVLCVGTFGILMGVFAATSVHSCGLIDQISESQGVCLLSLRFPLQIHPLCFLGCCRWCEGPPRQPTVPITRQITRRS